MKLILHNHQINPKTPKPQNPMLKKYLNILNKLKIYYNFYFSRIQFFDQFRLYYIGFKFFKLFILNSKNYNIKINQENYNGSLQKN